MVLLKSFWVHAGDRIWYYSINCRTTSFHRHSGREVNMRRWIQCFIINLRFSGYCKRQNIAICTFGNRFFISLRPQYDLSGGWGQLLCWRPRIARGSFTGVDRDLFALRGMGLRYVFLRLLRMTFVTVLLVCRLSEIACSNSASHSSYQLHRVPGLKNQGTLHGKYFRMYGTEYSVVHQW